MNNKIKTLIGLLVFVIFIAGAYFAYNSLSNKIKPDTGAEQSVNTKADEQTPQGASTESEDKTKAADFTVLNNKGEPVKLSDFFGKPIVVNFWASWCPPCRSEMPHFDKAYSDYKDKVNFLMVDLVDGQRETVEIGQDYIAGEGFAFPVYFDTDQEAAFAYMIQSIPTTLFIDSQGNIVKKYTGAMDEETLKGYLEKIEH
ncbi:MAG: Peroxiredoxin [Eubacterium sp.]|jgi:thiol-disulfide isomerase/thioredoxin|nr:Peroxiredoxin [Eubacterium sp.]